MANGDRLEVAVWSAELRSESSVVRAETILSGVAFVTVLAIAVLAVLALPPISGGIIAWALVAPLFPILTLTSLIAPYLATTRHAQRVLVDELGLVLDPGTDPITIPREDIALAWAVAPGRIEILTRQKDRCVLRLRDASATVDTLSAIRALISRSQSYAIGAHLDLLRTLVKPLATLAAAACATQALFSDPIGAAVWLAVLPVAWLCARGTRSIELGADGFTIQGRLRSRFIPYREVASVHRGIALFFERVIVELESGERVVVAKRAGAERARLIEALLVEGRAMVDSGRDAGASVPTLERGEEDLAEWEERVTMTAGKHGYRNPALDPERLASMLRNPAVSPEQRLGAALAVRRSPGGQAILRSAAEVSSDPEVRRALLALAEGSTTVRVDVSDGELDEGLADTLAIVEERSVARVAPSRAGRSK
ncbi:MAG: hypothetical protein AB7S26_36215 [Sandaracinaceae bacterium]